MKFWDLVVKTLKQKNNQAVAEKVVKITESTTNIKSPSFPDLNKYRVNPSGKRYDDTYITGVGYKLREILLLVWWGRTKKTIYIWKLNYVLMMYPISMILLRK